MIKLLIYFADDLFSTLPYALENVLLYLFIFLNLFKQVKALYNVVIT